MFPRLMFPIRKILLLPWTYKSKNPYCAPYQIFHHANTRTQYIEEALTHNQQFRQSLISVMQFYVIPAEQIVIIGVRNLLTNHPNYHMMILIQVLHKSHTLSSTLLDISPSPTSYSIQCPLTKNTNVLAVLFSSTTSMNL